MKAARNKRAAGEGQSCRVLLLEDNVLDAQLFMRTLQRELNVSVEWVASEDEFSRAMEAREPDVVISDFNLSGYDGLEAFKKLHARLPHVPFIMLSGCADDETAYGWLREGVTDYILKDRYQRLGHAVRRALRWREMCEELMASWGFIALIARHITDLVTLVDNEGRILYASPSCQKLWKSGTAPEGLAFYELVAPVERRQVREAFEETVARHCGRRLEYTLLTHDAGSCLIEAEWSVVPDERGRTTAVVISARDVGERRAQEPLVQKPGQV